MKEMLMPQFQRKTYRQAVLYKKSKLPFIVWLIAVSTVISFTFGNIQIGGYNLTGFAWVIPFAVASFVLLKAPLRSSFPLFLWLPWALVVIGYWILSDLPSLQRSAQILCPVVVGMAVSTFRFSPADLSQFIAVCKYIAMALVGAVIIKTGILLTGQLPQVTGLAAEVMTGMLLCSLFAARHVMMNEKKSLTLWAALASVPVLAVTRAAIVATGLTLPLTLAPMKLKKRLFILTAVILVGLAVFYSPRIQNKMFRGGTGDISDVMNRNVADSGRFHMWEQFSSEIKEEPFFGHGVGSGEDFTRRITGGMSGYPHNDWLLTLYDYGIFGTAVFALTILFAMLHAHRRGQRTKGETGLLFLSGAASFVPFAMLMYTDNILVYASFFGNLQFTILGVAYGSQKKSTSIRRKTGYDGTAQDRYKHNQIYSNPVNY